MSHATRPRDEPNDHVHDEVMHMVTRMATRADVIIVITSPRASTGRSRSASG
jgi:hypothetical protein